MRHLNNNHGHRYVQSRHSTEKTGRTHRRDDARVHPLPRDVTNRRVATRVQVGVEITHAQTESAPIQSTGDSVLRHRCTVYVRFGFDVSFLLLEFFLQVWNKNASRNGTAQRPDGHEEPDGEDGEECGVVEPAVSVARDEFVEEGCS